MIKETTFNTGIFVKSVRTARTSEDMLALLMEGVQQRPSTVREILDTVEADVVRFVESLGATVHRGPHSAAFTFGQPGKDAKGVYVLLNGRKHRRGVRGHPRHSPRLKPRIEDASALLGHICMIRMSMEQSNWEVAMREMFHFGAVWMRLQVRPYEHEAKVGRRTIEVKREVASKRSPRAQQTRIAILAEFEELRPRCTSDGQAITQVAERLDVSRSLVYSRVREARRGGR